MQATMLEKLKEAAQRFWDETVLGNFPDVGKPPAPVKVAHEITTLYGLHNILRYDQYDPETGLFYNDHSVAFCFEVIAQTGANEDMSARLNTLFTPIPPHVGIQWCLFGSPLLHEPCQAYLDLRHIAVDNGKTTPFFEALAQRRIDALRQAVGQPLWPNDPFMVKNIRLLFSITRTGTRRDHKLIEEMVELRETLRASLRTANLPAFPLDADGLIDFLWPILNPACMFTAEPFPALHYDDGKSIKEQITALGQHVRVKANEILWGLPPEKAGDDDTRIAARGFGVLQYPQKKELWEMANIIGSFFDDGLQYPCPFLICGGVFTLDPNAVNTQAQLKCPRPYLI